MDEELLDKTALVYDYGYSIGLARRLAREFGKVQYFSPWKDKNPESLKLAMATGYPDIERVRHFNDAALGADIIIFTDIYDGDLQRDWVNRGKRVWGSRKGDRLEYDRPYFLQTLEEVGLPVPEYRILQGVDALDAFCRENENWWIKVNLRGDDETWHHVKYEWSKRKLETIRHRWGPIGNDVVFTAVGNIDTDIEAAYDGFCVTSPDGVAQFPDVGFLGYENKDCSHILTAIPYDQFPDAVREVNELFAPALGRYFIRSAFGTEVKIVDGINFFLDATCRQPDPPGPIVMEMVQNLGEFFWHGSEGELVPLEIEQPFGVQVEFYSECSKTNWCPIEFPSELDRWVKVSRCCFRDGINQVIPDVPVTPKPEGYERIVSVVALGDTIEEAINQAKDYCDQVKGPMVTNEVASLAEVLKRIKEGEKQGIEFADEVPEPAAVLDNGS
jgi:hypothetical protein